jgi:hypothetical protein
VTTDEAIDSTLAMLRACPPDDTVHGEPVGTAIARLEAAKTLRAHLRSIESTPGHRCFFCGGPAHPATGCQYTSNVIACYSCTTTAWAWVRRHVNGKGRRKGPSFYDHVKGPERSK